MENGIFLWVRLYGSATRIFDVSDCIRFEIFVTTFVIVRIVGYFSRGISLENIIQLLHARL